MTHRILAEFGRDHLPPVFGVIFPTDPKEKMLQKDSFVKRFSFLVFVSRGTKSL